MNIGHLQLQHAEAIWASIDPPSGPISIVRSNAPSGLMALLMLQVNSERIVSLTEAMGRSGTTWHSWMQMDSNGFSMISLRKQAMLNVFFSWYDNIQCGSMWFI